MDNHADVDAVRRKAILFLHDVLNRNAGRPPLQTAEGIVDLAFEDSNPIKDVFVAASTNDRPSAAQPTDTIKSWLSKFPRRDNKSGQSDSKAAGSVSQVCDLQSMPTGTSALYAEILGDPPPDKSILTSQSKKGCSRSIGRSGTVKAPVKPVPNSSVFSSSPNLTKASGSNRYKCIVCQDKLSSKGVCKRHIEEQHVTPKIFKCEKCGDRFEVKAEAKKHANACGQGVFLYTVGKQDEKKIYACEFTGDCFLSKPKYVDHLLALSERIETRPEPDPRLKLCALLNQPSLQQQVSEISSKKFLSRRAWRNLQWSEAHVSKAIEELEDATLHDNGTIEFGKTHAQQKVQNARVYLNSLLGAGSLPKRNSGHSSRSRSSTMTQRRSPHGSDSGMATPTMDVKGPLRTRGSQYSLAETSAMEFSAPVLAPEAVMATISAEMRNKRHLSDQSRAFVPSRQPPGPPAMPQIPYAISPSMPDLPQYALPQNTPTTSLPFRTQEVTTMIDQPAVDIISHRTGSTATPTLSSDGASESTTLMSSYNEPELIEQIPFDYNFYNAQQSVQEYPFTFAGNMDYGMTAPQYYYPGVDPSIRTSSIATDQTRVVDYDYNEHDQKLSSFEPLPSHTLPSHNTAHFGSTFFIDDDELYDSHGLS